MVCKEGRREEEEAEADGSTQQKQEPHTHKCGEGKKNMVVKARYLYIIVVEFYCASRDKKISTPFKCGYN